MSTSPAEIVRAFYDAVVQRDGDGIAALVAASFHEDAAFTWPASLPYGGRVEGRKQLSRLFTGMVGSPVPIGPDGLEVVNVIASGDQVAAELSFRWVAPGTERAIDSSALELWSFESGRVVDVRAYYWDTAACRDLINHHTAASADA